MTKKPLLPQDEPANPERQRKLERARSEYVFDYSYYELGFAERCPLRDQYSLKCIELLVDSLFRYYSNRAEVLLEQFGDDLEELPKEAYTDLERKAREFVEKWLGGDKDGKGVAGILAADAAVNEKLEPGSIPNFEAMFKNVPVPATASHWDEDWFFAYQMVIGAVPNAISCIEQIPSNFPLSCEQYRAATGDTATLAEALADKRVFLLDLGFLSSLVGTAAGSSSTLGVQQVSLAPMALFAWITPSEPTLNGFGLQPVAIQCGQQPGPDYPIFTPSDGWRWKMARACVTGALGGANGYYEHFGTHMIMERCVLSTYRTLAENHPIYILLNPSFEYTLAANVGAKIFTEPGSFVDNLMAPALDASLAMTLRCVNDFSFELCSPVEQFTQCGLADSEVLPVYPFRDDTMRIWALLEPFVAGYVGLYYSDDAAVVADVELQAWVAELQAEQGGRLNGVGVDGKVETVAALSDLVAKIMYRGSAFHAALNYSAFDAFGYPLVMSYAPFVGAPTLATPNTEAEFIARMPSMRYAWQQLQFVWIQHTLWENRLGGYKSYFADPRVAPLVEKFDEGLLELAQKIGQENKTSRPMPYMIQQPDGHVTASLQA